MIKRVGYLILCTYMLGCMGCSPKVGIDESVCKKDCGDQNSLAGPSPTPTPTPPPTTTQPPPSGVDPSGLTMTSKIVGGSDNGLVAIEMNIDEKVLILSLPLPILHNLSAAAGTVADFGSYTTTVQEDTSLVIQVKIPLKKIISDVTRGPSTILPNGNTLPGSDLPTQSSSFAPNYQLSIYAGANAATIRLQSDNWANQGLNPGDSPANLSQILAIRSVQTGMTYGTYSMFTGIAGGFYIHAVLPEILATELHQRLD